MWLLMEGSRDNWKMHRNGQNDLPRMIRSTRRRGSLCCLIAMQARHRNGRMSSRATSGGLEIMDIGGSVQPGFERLREAFAENFSAHGDIGAACCVYRDGRPVVDVWGGVADPVTGRPWQRDTVQLVFSAAKGPTAICIHRLAEQGLLDIDAPVARYWPEFAAAGKQHITTRMVLAHRAGLAAVAAELSLEEVLAWDPVVAAIAAQEPEWEPDSAHGYHARTFGWILGEIIRRVTGESPGRHLARTVSGPLGLDYWVGLPAAELPRCARLVPPDADHSAAAVLGANSLTVRVMTGPSGLFGYNEMWNRPDVLAAEMPSSNGVGSARALAKLYAACCREVDGIRLLRPGTVSEATRVASRGPDMVILHESCFGLGFSLPPMLAPGAGPRAFGHPGAGGSLAFVDPEPGISFAYVTNRMRFDATGDPRGAGLVRALYDCLR
jgi:CubicO group peptidase (beta-lactamase class C family)